MPISSHTASSTDQDSVEIATLLRERNPQVWNRLVAYAVPLSKILTSKFEHLGEADIEDIVYETFLQIYQEGGKYDPQKAKFRVWLIQKAYFNALTLLRQKGAQPSQAWADLEEVSSSDSTSYKEVEGPSPMMEALLQQLPPKRAKVIRLYYYERMSEDMIAQQLNIKPSTVRVHRHHGLNDLRHLMSGQDDNT